MLLSSELIVELGTSKIYCRLALVSYLFSIALIIHSSLFLLIKLLLITVILIQYGSDCVIKKPYAKINALGYSLKKWIVIMNNEQQLNYDEATILIHNILFQLIKLSSGNKNKLLILFNDQIPNEQLRLLHIKMAK